MFVEDHLSFTNTNTNFHCYTLEVPKWLCQSQWYALGRLHPYFSSLVAYFQNFQFHCNLPYFCINLCQCVSCGKYHAGTVLNFVFSFSSCVEDMDHIMKLQNDSVYDRHYMDMWEIVINRPHLKAWRQPVNGTHLYQYKGGCLINHWEVMSSSYWLLVWTTSHTTQ